jgi:hypothetical protein
MAQIATTIEQSKHLLELGLDPKTADMCLCKTAHDTWFLAAYTPGEYDAHTAPAWSLSALLEVMPKEEASSTIFLGCVSTLVRCKSYDFMWQHDSNAVQPVTASYEMVCWLLEKGYITEGGAS